MSGEPKLERKPDSRQVSLHRLERKVDRLASRIEALNLNGSAEALKRLADNSDQLLELARIAPTVVGAVERDVELAIARRVIRRWFNPLRPLGAAIWLLFTTVLAAIAWNLITLGGVHHP